MDKDYYLALAKVRLERAQELAAELLEKMCIRDRERDWNQFLASVGGENNPYLQWPINPYSPWGMLLEPERDLGSARPFRPEMLLSLLVLLLLVLAALFLFRGG